MSRQCSRRGRKSLNRRSNKGTRGARRMRILGLMWIYLLACVLGCVCYPMIALSQTAASEVNAQSTDSSRDGQHDFDFEIGRWKTHLKRLINPLTGSTTWVEYEGTTVVRKVWQGRANLVELVADGP